jgi:hypothetical protein
LFKAEFTGDGMIALCSKTYYCFGAEDKFSSKGVNRKTNDINKDTYMDVLLTKQERAGFSYFYPKRKVLDDSVSTKPLDI